MNERIRDLWLQAAREDSGDTWDSQTQFIERFALLIVKECFKVQVTSSVNRYGWDKYGDGTALLNHFGVTYEQKNP